LVERLGFKKDCIMAQVHLVAKISEGRCRKTGWRAWRL